VIVGGLILIAMQIFVEVVLGQKIGFYMANGFIEGIVEFVKILFVQMDFTFDKVAVVELTSFAFRNGNVVVIISCGFHIEEISAFAGPDSF
jgi:hypothetical protein